MEQALWRGPKGSLWACKVIEYRRIMGRDERLIVPQGIGVGELWVTVASLVFPEDDAWPIDPIEAALAMSDDDVLAVMRPKPSWLD